MEFNTPIKKNNIYISTSTKSTHLYLIDVKIIKTVPINDTKIELYLKIENEDLKEIFNNIEISTLNTIKENNNKWFKNSLSNEQINELYEPSFDVQTGILRIFIYKNNSPRIIYKDNVCNSIFELLKYDLSNITIHIDIKFVGICIYSTKFYNIWVIKNIQCLNDDEIDISDKITIYDSWNTELTKIDKQIEDKIEELKILRENMWNIYNESKNSTEWKNELDNLRLTLTNFFI
jgi:regulator of replication initiation timing